MRTKRTSGSQLRREQPDSRLPTVGSLRAVCCATMQPPASLTKRASQTFVPHRTFVAAAAALSDDSVWQHRHAIAAVSLLFGLHGCHSLLLVADRARWTFPLMTNSRALLLLHWALAAPFLAGVLFQRLTVGAVAEAGTRGDGASQRRLHRLVGTCTLACSAGALFTALLLARLAVAARVAVMSAFISDWAQSAELELSRIRNEENLIFGPKSGC